MKNFISKVAVCSLVLFCSSFVTANPKMPVEEFVEQIFFEGVPFEEAILYQDNDVNVLLEMLEDPSKEAYWANVVVTLEIIGGEDVVDDIISFIEKDLGDEITTEQNRAKTAAIYGLGYLINRTGSKKAENYLKNGINTASWNRRGVMGLSPIHKTNEERNVNLSKYAILGLALAGRQSSIDILTSLKSESVPSTALQGTINDVIDSAIAESVKIRDSGMSRYKSHKH